MNQASTTHVVIIPSYNTGAKLLETVRNARAFWTPVWVVVDGSNDGSAEQLAALAQEDSNIRIFVLPENRGKGAAVLHGLHEAAKARFTHALTMDADGQHPAEKIAEFMAKSIANPNALVLGLPQFDASAPSLRVRGRKVSNWWANLETCWQGIGDSLFGFRVYPIKPLIDIMETNPWMRRFDFDVEAAVRLVWRGVRPINIAAPVKYFNADEGGVSHFNYVRDNLLLTWMHTRLFCGFVVRLPWLLWLRGTASSRLRKQH
jgi:glycosyltransferase involved in cell wall biosynthesis